MQESRVWLVCAAASYLLGAIPFGYLIGRARGVDVRSAGSGNIGATNVFRVVGKPWGVLTFLADMLKGFAAVCFLPRWAEQHLAGGATDGLRLLCACCAVAGHNWPVFLRFRGGKGVATGAGALLGLAWPALLIGLAVWTAVFLVGRYVSLASLAAAGAIAACAWPLYARRGAALPAALTALALLVVWRHRANIARLRHGTEHRFQFRRGPNRETAP